MFKNIPDPVFDLTLNYTRPSKAITKNTVLRFSLWKLPAKTFLDLTRSGSTLYYNNVVSSLASSPSFLGRGLNYSTNLPFKVQAIPGVKSTAHVIKSRLGTTSEKRPDVPR
jgi:hypothetical protein